MLGYIPGDMDILNTYWHSYYIDAVNNLSIYSKKYDHSIYF